MHNKPTAEYKYTCQECGMGFTKAFHLAKHKKEHKNHDEQEQEQETVHNTPDIDIDEKPVVKTEVEEQDEQGEQPLAETEPEPELPKLRPKKEPDDKQLHPCKVCNKILTTPAGLSIHMRRHTGRNLSQCYVIRHMRSP